LNGSLKRLGCEQIVLYQLHGPTSVDYERGECLEFLERAKKAGKIQWAGVSLYNPLESSPWLREDVVDSLQTLYNRLHPELGQVLGEIKETGKALLVRSVFAFGLLSGKYDVSSTFPKNDHRRQFSEDQRREIFDKIAALKQKLDCSPQELFESCLPFCLSPEEVSSAIVGVKTSAQLAEILKPLKVADH